MSEMSEMSTVTILADLWRPFGLPDEVLAAVELPGAEPALPSSFRVGAAAQASIAAVACVAAALGRARTGRVQRVRVPMRAAAAEFRSESYLRADGRALGLWDPITGAYPCGDGRWVRLHANFPHHRDGILRLLDCAHDRETVAHALLGWEAQAFEDAASAAGLVAVKVRTFDEWDAHSQGQAVAALPLVAITKLGDAPARPLKSDSTRPLSDVRVLDLTRVIAGPVCGRVLAAHGAQVLNVSAACLPSMEATVVDTGRGKRTTFLDLSTAEGRDALRRLIADADIFVQSYRQGALAARGFGPEAVAALRPGIVYVSLTAYGQAGPWAARRGFDSIVQAASGFNDAEATAARIDQPKPLPCQALDHASGYLMAFGALAGLLRRAQEGGSWHVEVSLARTGRWLRDLGRLNDGFACPNPAREDLADLLEESESGWGRLSAVRHAAAMSETSPRWELPSMPLGSHPPEWW